MNILVIVLRILHIVGGVFWVGTAMFSTFFISPAMAATGEAGRAFMDYLMSKARLSTRISAASGMTVLAGAILYWIDSGGLTSAWTTSGPGVGFGIGAVLALVGIGVGAMVGVNAKKLGRIAAAAQGKPSETQVAQMKSAQASMSQASLWSTIALIASLACMATARYWLF